MKRPTDEQIYAGKIAREAIKLGMTICKNGTTGLALDKRLEEFIRDNKCSPAIKGYKPPFSDVEYKHTICLSLNNQAVHGVPQDIAIDQNDLITIDLVVEHRGMYVDTARTFTFSDDAAKLAMVEAIKTIHNSSLEIISPDMPINIYATFCDKVATDICKIKIIGEYCGHGIGKSIHELPQIPCIPTTSKDLFKVGHSYAVEPVVAQKKKYTLSHGKDGWVVNADCLTAHMEDTIFITSAGIINLTN